MNKEKEFAKNTVILLLGKFMTQLLTFLLLPLYTYKLATDDYGYIDLLQTYISLLVPILLLQLDSAVFRFLIEYRNDSIKQKEIITNSAICIFFISIVIIFISVILNKFFTINYFCLIILNILALMINFYFLSISRGFSDSVTYSISSIITCVITFFVNFVLILLCGFDARSILIASIIANLCAAIYICIKKNVYKYISFKNLSKEILNELLKYSIPMIPNVISWWIVGLSDRTMITYFISITANAIYSVACKFSNLINSIFAIFNISWQETASIHINDDDANEFFSKMILSIYKLFVILSCGIIGLLPLVFNIFIGNEYIEAYKYIPILILANICYVMDGLLGGIYVARKMIKKVAITTTISAIINIVINFLLIKKIALFAATISTLIAYFSITIYRYWDIKKFMNIKLNIKSMLIYIFYYFVLMFSYYLELKVVSIIVLCIILCLYMIENRDIIQKVINKFVNKINLKK